jgi:DNA-directed RNA polymerase subunit H (RpoH/RPB5)
MEDKALEILRVMLGRRGLDTKTDRVVIDEFDRANLYTIGKVFVIFSQKESGLVMREILAFYEIAGRVGYTNGVIVVTMVPLSENMLSSFKQIRSDRSWIQLFHIRELQFDITTHRMAMPHRILKEDEKTAVFKRYNIESPILELPKIDSQDAMVKWIGAVPGDVVEITRHSDVAGPQLYYRYVVRDVNLA